MLKEISPEYSLEGLMLKLQYFGHLMGRTDGLIPGLGGSPGEGKGYPLQYSGLENSMDYRGRKESDMTE